jgi:AraC-like DNA-binding protein
LSIFYPGKPLVISRHSLPLTGKARPDQKAASYYAIIRQRLPDSHGVTLIQRKALIESQTMECAVRYACRTSNPGLRDVAKAMGVSPRSLQRLLMEQGTTFSHILERSRRQRAMQLLVKQDLTISEVAGMLGYSDPSNFGRVVRKWTGQSPKRWRENP